MNAMHTAGARRGPAMRRIGQLLAALAIIAGLSVATAGTAAAANVGEWACNCNTSSNTCLFIANLGGGVYPMHVGVDLHMTQRDAQNIIDGDSQATATLFGDDNRRRGPTRTHRHPRTGLWATTGGLSVEFNVMVDQSLLNEDKYANNVDELIAQVKAPTPATQSTLTLLTGEDSLGHLSRTCDRCGA